MTRNPIKDQTAIVGIGSTGFRRTIARSNPALAYEAATKAITDAGLRASDIDGIVGTDLSPAAPTPQQMASALGIADVTHHAQTEGVVGTPLIDAMNAVFSGSCEAVLVYHSVVRYPANSQSSVSDPFRRGLTGGGTKIATIPEDVRMSVGYAAWSSRYIYEYQPKREHFGYVAINARSNGVNNPLAVMQEPISMDDYLAARMVRAPMCMLDMDVPVDGADAFVITAADRAKDLRHKPILIHAATSGMVDRNEEEQLPGLHSHGHHVVARSLKAKSDLWLGDVDVYFPYDGFSIITLAWIENIGWCHPGEAGPFLEDHWDTATNRIKINGRVPINPHGGALSEGANHGSGHLREAVVQLRGDGGVRQIEGAKTALITPGGFFLNSQGVILRVE